SRTPFYSSEEAAWPLTDEAFARLHVEVDSLDAAARAVGQDRQPVWVRLNRSATEYDVYLVTDRFGIYALGFPVVTPLGHLMNLAELTVLAIVTYLLLLGGSGLFGWLGARTTTAPMLLREVRASFY